MVVGLVLLLALLLVAGVWVTAAVREHTRQEAEDLAAKRLAAAQRMHKAQGYDL